MHACMCTTREICLCSWLVSASLFFHENYEPHIYDLLRLANRRRRRDARRHQRNANSTNGVTQGSLIYTPAPYYCCKHMIELYVPHKSLGFPRACVCASRHRSDLIYGKRRDVSLTGAPDVFSFDFFPSLDRDANVNTRL